MRELHAPRRQSNPVKPSQGSLTEELWFDSIQTTTGCGSWNALSACVALCRLPAKGASSAHSLSHFDHRTAWYRLIPVGIGYQAKNLHWQSVYSKPTTGQPPFLAQAEATGRRSRNLPIIFHKWYQGATERRASKSGVRPLLVP